MFSEISFEQTMSDFRRDLPNSTHAPGIETVSNWTRSTRFSRNEQISPTPQRVPVAPTPRRYKPYNKTAVSRNEEEIRNPDSDTEKDPSVQFLRTKVAELETSLLNYETKNAELEEIRETNERTIQTMRNRTSDDDKKLKASVRCLEAEVTEMKTLLHYSKTKNTELKNIQEKNECTIQNLHNRISEDDKKVQASLYCLEAQVAEMKASVHYPERKQAPHDTKQKETFHYFETEVAELGRNREKTVAQLKVPVDTDQQLKKEIRILRKGKERLKAHCDNLNRENAELRQKITDLIANQEDNPKINDESLDLTYLSSIDDAKIRSLRETVEVQKAQLKDRAIPRPRFSNAPIVLGNSNDHPSRSNSRRPSDVSISSTDSSRSIPPSIELLNVIQFLEDELKGENKRMESQKKLINSNDAAPNERSRIARLEVMQELTNSIDIKTDTIFSLHEVLEDQQESGQELSQEELDNALQSVGLGSVKLDLKGPYIPPPRRRSLLTGEWME